MLKGLLQEKSEILASKDGFLNRLENQIQTLNKENHVLKVQNEKQMEAFSMKETENQEKIQLSTLTINTRDCEIAKLKDLHCLQQKDAEKHLAESETLIKKLQNEVEVEKKRLDAAERGLISRSLETENLQKILKEAEFKRQAIEKELEKMHRLMDMREKDFNEDIERKTQERLAKTNERVSDLEVKLAESTKKKSQLEQKTDELFQENKSLKEELEKQKFENQDIKIKIKVITEEKAKFLSDYRFLFICCQI